MTLVRILDLVGVGVFAVSGTLAAGRKRLDPVGVGVIAVVTALGGGTIRDLLMRRPIFWLTDTAYLITIFVASALTILYVRYRRPPERELEIADALGLALFAMTGSQIAETAQLPALMVVVIAVITCTFGGLLRDVLCNEVPFILGRGHFYATAVIAGSICYLILQRLGIPRIYASFSGMAVVASLRIAAIYWNLTLPVFDLERHRNRP
ncbi:trimeric intracellular cation channel family protein [Solimonas marina]|uniref:Trimeric intracellular cation channel family protein n=1 Tax=Solimonas marina TaxID=2714601 RepID=A0A969W980_9GAMM|nr:trimeric intracellular cation channel family protein [Solimonas marina]NKF22229.1 trimeric intracellular cation channel family protein [Solimonas marina]